MATNMVTSTVMGMVTATKATPTKGTRTANPAGTATLITMRIAELTALLHLASPALPIGAFSYSQGLEAAIEARLITDADSARDWIASGLTDVLAHGELRLSGMGRCGAARDARLNFAARATHGVRLRSLRT